MSDKRPLIFIKPYSETLKKLFEVCNEIKDQENFEIFEIESNAEFAQVIVSAGASLTLFSSLKKCALILQEQKRNIFRMKSKVILLSPKNIDRKIHEKFTKIGLTEMVVEPIAPKTLVHKVKLLLRSLPKTQVESDTDDQTVKSGEDAATPEAAGQATKSDGGKYNKIDGYMTTKINKKTELKLTDDKEEKAPEEGVNYLEEALSKKRKTYTEAELQEIDKQERATSEAEKIDTHYRNKESNNFQLTDDSDAEKKKKERAELEDAVFENRPKSAFALEEETQNKKKKAAKLDLEDEEDASAIKAVKLEKERADNDSSAELLLSNDKSKKASREPNLNADEDEQDKKAATKLLLAQEDETKAAQEKDSELLEREKKKLQRLELEVELEKQASLEVLNKAEKEKKKITDLELQNEKDSGDDAETSPAEFIDKYYRNDGKEKTEEEIDSKASRSLNKNLNESKARELPDNLPEVLEETTELDENKSPTKLNLSSEAEDKETTPRELEDDEEETKAPVNLDLETEAELKRTAKEKIEKEKLLEDKLTDLELEDDQTNTAAKENLLGDEDFAKKKKGETNLDLLDDSAEKQRSLSKVDNIQTHYGMKSLERKVDQNWDKLGQSDNVTDLATAKKNRTAQARAFEFDIKKEEEFNFEKTEKEFSSVDPFFRNLKEKYGTIDYENNVAVDKEGNRVPLDEALEAIIAENQHLLGEAVESLETDQVFLVSPLGITGMIEASGFYHDKKKKGVDLLKFLAKKIFDDYGAITTFIHYDLKAKTQKNWYAGHIELDLPSTNREQRETHWQTISSENQKAWKNVNETTFTEKFLVYPFQEGVTNLGMAVVEFTAATDENRMQGIQNILSCALGLYYQEYHATLAKKEEPKKNIEDSSKPAAGFFSKVFGLFGKKAS